MADAVMATDVGQVSRLDVLLTTVELLTRTGGGAFGKIWRSSLSDARQSWLARQRVAKKDANPAVSKRPILLNKVRLAVQENSPAGPSPFR